MSRRTVALVVSLVLAAVSTVALVSYVKKVENKSLEGQKAVDVYVAKDTIPAGTSGDVAASKNLIEKTQVPQKVRADGSILSLEEIKGKVAAVTIYKGEQILSTRFQLPSQIHGTLPIPNGKVAIAVEVGIPPGVAGFVVQGSRVSIIAQLEVPKRGSKTETEKRVQFLLQNVEVLSIGQRTVTTVQGQEGQAQTTVSDARVLATVALSAGDAEKLTYAILNGTLYFTLLPEQGAQSFKTPGRTKENAFK